MLRTYMTAFNIEIHSENIDLLLKYYIKSQEYERNFQSMHKAFKAGNTGLWRVFKEFESELYGQCRRLRKQLNIIENPVETAEPNRICASCGNRFYAPLSRQNNKRQCKDCYKFNQQNYYRRKKENLIDLNFNIRKIDNSNINANTEQKENYAIR